MSTTTNNTGTQAKAKKPTFMGTTRSILGLTTVVADGAVTLTKTSVTGVNSTASKGFEATDLILDSSLDYLKMMKNDTATDLQLNEIANKHKLERLTTLMNDDAVKARLDAKYEEELLEALFD